MGTCGILQSDRGTIILTRCVHVTLTACAVSVSTLTVYFEFMSRNSVHTSQMITPGPLDLSLLCQAPGKNGDLSTIPNSDGFVVRWISVRMRSRANSHRVMVHR